ncbi:hypothetical protein D3C73_1451710 [compost metagenome]
MVKDQFNPAHVEIRGHDNSRSEAMLLHYGECQLGVLNGTLRFVLVDDGIFRDAQSESGLLHVAVRTGRFFRIR